MTDSVFDGPDEGEGTSPEGPGLPDPAPIARPSLWDRLRRARVPQLLGVYAGATFGILQVADIFVERLGLPEWTFFGLLLVLVAGVPVVVATALVQAGQKSLRMKELFSWRNTSYAGLVAVGALALAVGLFMGARSMGIGPVGSLVAAGVIERDESILIADFQSPTGDELLAGAITEAFRIDFEQSPIVRVVPPGAVRDGLIRMQQPPDAALTPALARELALREGIKAIILGEINRVGGGSIVSVRLVAPGSEEAIVSFRETIGDDSEVIVAVDRLSNRLRERLGESLRSIRAGEPLEQVSTSSLAALRRYSQGVRAIEMDRDFPAGISLLEEAIAEGSTFAMAWRKLGVTLLNQGRPEEEWARAFTRAYELSDRLPERERYLTRGSYYNSVARDPERAMAAYRALLETYPNETTALNNLAVIHIDRGERRQAIELLNRALAVDSFAVIYYTNLAQQYTVLEEWEAAEGTILALNRRFPGLSAGELMLDRMIWAQGRYQEAEERLRRRLEDPQLGSGPREDALWGLTALAILHGRGEEGLGYLDEIEDLRRRQGLMVARSNHLQFRAYYEMSVRGDTARVVQMVEDLLAREPLTEEAAREGAHLFVAAFLLQAGEVERGREYLEESDRILGDRDLPSPLSLQREMVGVYLRFLEGDREGALERVGRLVRDDPEDPELRSSLARLHDLAGQADSAVVQYEAYLATPLGRRMQDEQMTHPWILERLGQLYDSLGVAERAREYHLRFADLWASADPELQPRVERARAAAARLEEEG